MAAEGLSELKNVDDNKFRLLNTRIHLTYEGHIEPPAYIAWIRDKFRKRELVQFSVVQEVGETGYEHTHVLLKFDKKIDIKNCRAFDYDLTHPNIKKVLNNTHWNNVVAYHCKQGTPYSNIGATKSVRDEIEEIWTYDTVSDAILNACKSIKEVGGTIAAFNCKPIDYGKEPDDIILRPWQKKQMEIMEEKPHPDMIDWIWDPYGLAGKSFFSKYMGMYKGSFVTTSANIYHVATQLQQVINRSKKSVLACIFNLTRQTDKDTKKIYASVEALKDGMVSVQKYRGETLFFPTPHVVVFANHLPKLHKLTPLKWHLKIMDKDGKNFVGDITGEWIDYYIKKFLYDNNLPSIHKEGIKEAGYKLCEELKEKYGKDLSVIKPIPPTERKSQSEDEDNSLELLTEIIPKLKAGKMTPETIQALKMLIDDKGEESASEEESPKEVESSVVPVRVTAEPVRVTAEPVVGDLQIPVNPRIVKPPGSVWSGAELDPSGSNPNIVPEKMYYDDGNGQVLSPKSYEHVYGGLL